jgi:hypothetical protein
MAMTTHKIYLGIPAAIFATAGKTRAIHAAMFLYILTSALVETKMDSSVETHTIGTEREAHPSVQTF